MNEKILDDKIYNNQDFINWKKEWQAPNFKTSDLLEGDCRKVARILHVDAQDLVLLKVQIFGADLFKVEY